MKEIPNRIMFSEMEEIHKPGDLAKMIAEVLKLGLEGLVLKDLKSIYEPGKRHWLKVKKDYLFEGAMADTADLIVLGAWYGTGKKGGMMSVFLMGCYNPNSKRFCTVTKVHTGHDDKTLEKLQSELDMEKISQDSSKVPSWLNCTKTMIPDFVAKDPKKQPVWEITGAEFTRHDVHTADGISIRFPRVTRIRDDKSWETATNLQELQQLYKNSKENTDVSLLTKGLNKDYDNEDESPKKKKKKRSRSNSPQKKEKNKTDGDISDEAKVQVDSEENDDGLLTKIDIKKKKKSSDSKSPQDKANDNKYYQKTDDDDSDSQETSTSKKRKKAEKTSPSKKAKVDLKENDLAEGEQNESNVVSKKVWRDVEIINPLPDYFSEVKALVEEELKKEEHSEIIR